MPLNNRAARRSKQVANVTLPDTKPSRTQQEINNEYTSIAASIGDAEYKILTLKRLIDQFTDRIDELQTEVPKPAESAPVEETK